MSEWLDATVVGQRRWTDRLLSLQLSAACPQAMLCGNPAMLKDATTVLAQRGMRKHRRRDPGHITAETYW